MASDFAFTHKHYVPIIKTKAGERWALSHLTTRSQLTPLLELHAHKRKGVATHAGDICKDLASAWGTDGPVFLDTIWLNGSTGNPRVIADVFAAARNHGLQAIPVVRVSYDAPTLAQIRAVIDEDDREVMLRLTQSDLASTSAIRRTLDALKAAHHDVHLLVVYQCSPMNLASDVPRVPNLHDWRTFTAASGAFPRSLITLPQGIWHSLPRTDWTSWEPAVAAGQLARRPTFGDYTIRDPGAPADFGDPIVNVRYTSDTHWTVRVGGKHRAGASIQMKQICQDLIARPEYSGQQYSAGDAELHSTAQPRTPPGGPTQWLQWCVSHHLVFVVDQIQQHPSL